ncbi:hypothetical protein CYPRO_0215 [Cyclonatronum proteinivorum]|uniref:Uncharacterized protein n=1 Tax=Cyclonatronum proteinivorum TaxID=1457365 RepID=A0A345UGA1_9BACT|nr:hypothetical protein CYPRO_0215 [Cyclonatronum proteinivorum]
MRVRHTPLYPEDCRIDALAVKILIFIGLITDYYPELNYLFRY